MKIIEIKKLRNKTELLKKIEKQKNKKIKQRQI